MNPKNAQQVNGKYSEASYLYPYLLKDINVNLNEFLYHRKLVKNGLSKNKMDPEEWKEYWTEELDRCLNGYSVGGFHISGALYFYANHCKIEKYDEKLGSKVYDYPDLRDIDIIIDEYIEYCYHVKKNLILVAGRRLGKSYLSGARIYHNALIEKQASLVCYYGSDKGDELKNKIIKFSTELSMEINGYSNELYRPFISSDSKDKDMLIGIKAKGTDGKYRDQALGGAIYFRNYVNSFQAAAGISSKFVLFEEAGVFEKNLIAGFNNVVPIVSEGSKQYGVIVVQGTGGDMKEGGSEFKKMFYEPEPYNALVFKDEYNKKTSLFIPGYYSYNDCRTEGILDVEKASFQSIKKQETLKRNKQYSGLVGEKTYYPLTPEDAFLDHENSIFDVGLISDAIERIVDYKPITGFMELKNGKALLKYDDDLKPVSYPHKITADNTGCIEIYHMPSDSKSATYIATIDNYSVDKSDTSYSLGCMLVWRISDDPLNKEQDTLVAEYTGRPTTKNQFFEQCRLLAMFYNAKLLIENNIPGTAEYFINKGSHGLLVYQPKILEDKQVLSSNKPTNKYGIRTSAPIIEFGLNCINNWIMDIDETENYNIYKIKSINLLRELRFYNKKQNFDRVSAFLLLMILREDRMNSTSRSNKKPNFSPTDYDAYFTKSHY